MKIAIVTQYFYPENFIINDMVLELAGLGHEVEVFTGRPNYPDGEIFPGYDVDGTTSETWQHGVVVHRTPLRPRKAGGAKNLLLNYGSFVYNGLRHFSGLRKQSTFDVILVFAVSPMTAAIPAILLKYRSKAHLMIWVQDLWPESLRATGFISNRFLLWCTGLLVRSIYSLTDTLLVQSRAFIEPVARYAKRSKIVYYPNSYKVTESLNDAEAVNGLAGLLSVLQSNFCVVFAGNLGTAQSLDSVVEAARLLRHLERFKIVLVGSGSRSDWVAEEIDRLGLDNLMLAGRFPGTSMPQIFSASQALLVTLRPDEIFSYTIPSKIQAYMAAGIPIIAGLDGEGARVVLEAGAGLCSDAGDASMLAHNIETLYNATPEARADMGRRGREYFEAHFEMHSQCERLLEIFESRIAAKDLVK
ncbi:glycosyltransferase family 4 protein [Pseudomonas bharatica]|uniref:glycosyltransferase family 4 protein n=1 Tax=Pseudomonas bharatica TaxID=2692112 RepID=UPI003B27DB4E